MSSADAGNGLALIVVNFGSSDLLRRNLVRVHAENEEATVIIVDNFSSESEAEAVSELAREQGWTAHLLADNRGFGGGVNVGVKAAAEALCCDFLLLNPDATIDGRSVSLLRAAVAQDRFGIASPVVRAVDGSIWFAGADLNLTDGSMSARSRRAEFPAAVLEPWLSGACLLITTEVWERVGEFDESYFLYWEDVDLSRRVADAGGALHLVELATAIHDEGGTQVSGRSRGKSEAYYYFNIRNRLLYATRHLDSDGIRRWMSTSRRAANEILLRGGRRQFLRPLRPARAYIRGLRDGRRLAIAELSRRNHRQLD